MVKARHIAAIISLAALAECRGGAPAGNASAASPDASPGPLVAAVAAEMPGCFVLGGEWFGYQYELLEAYAAGLGRELRLVRGLSAAAIREKLLAGELDAAATLSDDGFSRESFSGSRSGGSAEGISSVPLYNTGYVLLAAAPVRRAPSQGPAAASCGGRGSSAVSGGYGSSGGRAVSGHSDSSGGGAADESFAGDAFGFGPEGYAPGGGFPREAMDTARIMVSAGFGRTRSYDRMLDLLPRARIFLTPRSGVELAAELAEGRFDFLVCERSEAAAALALTDGIYEAYRFPDEVGMSLLFGPRGGNLGRGFRVWLAGYRRSGGADMLRHLYLESGLAGRIGSITRPARVAGGISVWDGLLRRVGRREGIDWRLLSAIAYHESRFTPDAVSERGAQGLMQVMPVVARQFGADESRLMSPELNVLLAAKLLHRIGVILRLPDSLPRNDRLAMLLAAYNGGVGRVAAARRAAAGDGADCNDWAALEPYIVPRRAARYASEVLGRYESYCRAVDLQ